ELARDRPAADLERPEPEPVARDELPRRLGEHALDARVEDAGAALPGPARMMESRERAQVALDVVGAREPVDRALLLQPPGQPAHVLPELRVERREPLLEGGDVEGDGRRGHRDLDAQPRSAARPRVRQAARPAGGPADALEADELGTRASELGGHD